MIKRRIRLINNMHFIVENEDSNLFNAIDRIIELISNSKIVHEEYIISTL